MTGAVQHWLEVHDKLGFLHRLMVELAGGRISLEGHLSKCKFAEEVVVAYEEVGLLKRNTLFPKQDFVVLRLEQAAIVPIFKQIGSAGLSRAILHIQIEHGGVLQLGAYDNFHSECVVTGPGVSGALLSELKLKNVLSDYSIATKRKSC